MSERIIRTTYHGRWTVEISEWDGAKGKRYRVRTVDDNRFICYETLCETWNTATRAALDHIKTVEDLP